MSAFQVKLGGSWKDYKEEEDRILKRAWKSGFKQCRYELRGQKYEYKFDAMKQLNVESGRQRDIREPYGWKQPSKPLVPPGKTMTIRVPEGRVGKAVKVPHPEDKSVLFTVTIPSKAKVGQEILVSVPSLEDARAGMEAGDAAAVAAAGDPSKKAGGWSTGAKVGAGMAGAVVLGAGVVAGVMIAEHGAEGAADIAGDFAADAGGAIADGAGDLADGAADLAADIGADEFAADAASALADGAGDAGDFVCDAADTAGDFFMDLF